MKVAINSGDNKNIIAKNPASSRNNSRKESSGNPSDVFLKF